MIEVEGRWRKKIGKKEKKKKNILLCRYIIIMCSMAK